MSRALIEQAIEICGGTEAKLGDATGYSQNGIHQAKKRGHVSPLMALAIDEATKGVVSASKLRPDLWPSELHVPRRAHK